MGDKAKWTLMIYLAGDNNLSSAGNADLAEMRKVGSTSEVNILAQFDCAGDRGTVRYRIMRDLKDELVESLGTTDSGDPSTLASFVSWASEKFPAERYALVLWSHGDGWEPSEIDKIARSVAAYGYKTQEAVDRSSSSLGRTLFRTSLQTIFSLPSPADRAICSDDGSGHSLDMIELGKVLAGVTATLGQPLNLLGMDACLMSNLEVAYQIHPYVEYMVASEEDEPGNGWPYEKVLRLIVSEPSISAAELASHIVNFYTQFYKDKDHTDGVTQAAFNLSRIAELTHPIDELADALVSQMPAAAHNVWAAQRKSVAFHNDTLWDIHDWCDKLEKSTRDDTIQNKCRDVKASLRSSGEGFVIAESHHGLGLDNCRGGSIYLVPSTTEISRFYKDLEYAQKHRWLQFLRAYHAV